MESPPSVDISDFFGETPVSADFSDFDKAVEQFKRAALADLVAKKKLLDEYIQKEREKLANEKKRFREECQFMYRQYGVGDTDESSSAASEQISTFPTSIKVNVGGRIFHTTLTTLQGTHTGEEDSMLAAMFSQRHPNCKDPDGNVFIDRDGDRFAPLLDYLRTGKVGYFESLRCAHRLKQNDKQNVEFEQMLEEAQYFQLRRIVDVLQPCLSALPGDMESCGILRSENRQEQRWTWTHQECSNVDLYMNQTDGTITCKEEGTYLVMTRVPGVSSNNNGYVQLMLDDVAVGESWSGDNSGYHNMLYLNEVLQIGAGGRLQLQGVNLTHSTNLGRALATSFTLAPLKLQSKYTPFISLQSPCGSSSGDYWYWKYKAGNSELVDTNDNQNGDRTVTFDEAGIYLIMVRVPGVSTGNQGYVQLMLDDVAVGESWASDANGYHKMLHINEVLQIGAKGKLKLQNMNLSVMNRPLATSLTALRLGDASKNGIANISYHRYASFSNTETAANGSCWKWSCMKGCSEIVALADDDRTITITLEGTYLIMARVSGVSTSNNGYAQLMLNDAAIGESWGNHSAPHYRMLQFNEVLQIEAGGRLQIQNVNLSHCLSVGRVRAASFTVMFLAGVPKAL